METSCKCEGAAGTAPFGNNVRIEIITPPPPRVQAFGCQMSAVRRQNQRQDERDTRTDLLYSLRVPLGRAGSAFLLSAVTAAFRAGLIDRAARRELRILLGGA